MPRWPCQLSEAPSEREFADEGLGLDWPAAVSPPCGGAEPAAGTMDPPLAMSMSNVIASRNWGDTSWPTPTASRSQVGEVLLRVGPAVASAHGGCSSSASVPQRPLQRSRGEPRGPVTILPVAWRGVLAFARHPAHATAW